MCGIAGIVRITPPGDADAHRRALTRPHADAIPEQLLDALDASIRHRGPDGQGRFRDRAIRADGSIVDVAFVHRRLSIIDHAGGGQPMVSVLPRSSGGRDRSTAGPDADLALLPPPLLFHGKPNDTVAYKPLNAAPTDDLVAVIFNGCIYNHRELRAQLQAAGHRFVSDHSDTEVLLHGWREWQRDLSSKLDGMWAAAIWNRSGAEVLLTRDLAHEKPLYSATPQIGRRALGAIHTFASVPAALLRVTPLIGKPPLASSPDWVGDWIRFGASSDSASIERNWPARAMLHRIEQWGRSDWDFSDLPTRGTQSRLTVDSLDSLLDTAVRSRLEADVDLGAFLSGGVDSSLVCHYARRAVGTLRTYTVRMPDARYDESAHAEAVARQLGTQHRTLECDARPADDLVHLIGTLGVPFGDSSLLPAAWVSRAARREVRVALTGDGGDELFGGYERHVAARRLFRHPALSLMLRAVPAGLLSDRNPKNVSSKLRRLTNAARHGYGELRAIFPMHDLSELMPQCDWAWYHLSPMREPDPLANDFYSYLGPDLLLKSDTASMQVSLETRSPLLARSVVDAALTEPLSSLMPCGQRKGLLRAVARKYLPAEIVDRPKQGFAIPIGEWFRSDYGGMKTLLLDRLNSIEPFGPPSLGIDLNMKFVRQMIDEHMDGKRDHSQRLYMLLVLSLWTDSLR